MACLEAVAAGWQHQQEELHNLKSSLGSGNTYAANPQSTAPQTNVAGCREKHSQLQEAAEATSREHDLAGPAQAAHSDKSV